MHLEQGGRSRQRQGHSEHPVLSVETVQAHDEGLPTAAEPFAVGSNVRTTLPTTSVHSHGETHLVHPRSDASGTDLLSWEQNFPETFPTQPDPNPKAEEMASERSIVVEESSSSLEAMGMLVSLTPRCSQRELKRVYKSFMT